AKAISSVVFAKIELKAKDRILVIPENFEAHAKLGGEASAGILSSDFLDLILVHEFVHIFQNRKFGLKRDFGKPKSREELTALSIADEGHAQFITQKVAEERGLLRSFELLERVVSEVPASITDPALRLLFESAQQYRSFPYVQGRRFFTSLVGELGYAGALARTFEKPPRSHRQVSHPEEYLSPTKSRFDLTNVAEYR